MRRRYIKRRTAGLVCAAWICAGFLLCLLPSFAAETALPIAETALPINDPAKALRDALKLEDPVAAAARFAALSGKFEIIADHASLLRSQKLAEAGLHKEAASAAEAALDRYAESPLRADFEEILGTARAALADEDPSRN